MNASALLHATGGSDTRMGPKGGESRLRSFDPAQVSAWGRQPAELGSRLAAWQLRLGYHGLRFRPFRMRPDGLHLSRGPVLVGPKSC